MAENARAKLARALCKRLGDRATAALYDDVRHHGADGGRKRIERGLRFIGRQMHNAQRCTARGEGNIAHRAIRIEQQVSAQLAERELPAHE